MMRSLWLAVLLAVTTCAHAAEPVKQPGIGETPPPIGLKDREGNSVDLVVQDPSQLALIKKGDQVEAVFTEALAIAVEPAPKAAAPAPKK